VSLWSTITGWFWGRPTDTNTIVNFAQVDKTLNLWRGGQFISSAEVQKLMDLGIKTVVKLNEEVEGTDDLAESYGLTVVKCEISLVDQTIGSPSRDTVIRATAAMAAGNCYVHCEHGQDRTGLVCACFRVWVQRWSKASAQSEKMKLGFHPLLAGLENFWRDQVT
jgi:protein tyrosine/serine phosphatase